MRASLIGPLREIYGVSDKVLTMALSCILLGAPTGKALWAEVGASMIAIDTLVHNINRRGFDKGLVPFGAAAAPATDASGKPAPFPDPHGPGVDPAPCSSGAWPWRWCWSASRSCTCSIG